LFMLKPMSPHGRSLLLWGLIGVACATSAAAPTPPPKGPSAASPAEPARAEPARAGLRQPEWLPDEVSEMLSERMQRHGRQMMFLLMDVLTLNHEETAAEAEAIAAEPRFGRPAPGEKGTISSLLPAQFFDLEDQLHAQAHELAQAAGAADEPRVVAAYGLLTQTCVTCHSVYLHHDADDDGTSGD
jgi:hypothetical protein